MAGELNLGATVRHTVDAGGWQLALFEHPSASPPRAAALVVHAMMAHSGYLAPLADALASAGVAAFRLDLRGRGASPPFPPEGDWTFDDLVEHDLPAAVAAVRALAPDTPVWLVGHSLGGLLAVAREGRHPGTYDGIVALSSGLWGLETGLPRHLLRRALIEPSVPLVHLARRVPARFFGVGPDESRSYWRQYVGWVRRRRFDALDGFDYTAASSGIRIPCHGLLGARDPFVGDADQRILLRMPSARFEVVPGAGHFSLVHHAALRVVRIVASR